MSATGDEYDAIVVGGGHNGLVCAAYLAREGLRTLVLERRPEVGGMAGTHELLPGVRVPALAHTLGRLRPSIARDLDLAGLGLSLVQPDARVSAPRPDGRAVTLWTDPARTAAELAATGIVGERDAERYEEVDQALRALASALAVLNGRTPPDLAGPSLADALAGMRASLASRSRVPAGSGGLLRVLPMAVADLVAEWFESDALRALLSARAVRLSALGPLMPGTAGLLIADAAGADAGLAGETVYARGGPAALSAALAAAARTAGAEIRTDAEVVAVRAVARRAAGVRLASGAEINAPLVAAGVDPQQALLKLIDPELLGPRLSWRAANIRQAGASAKVNLALRDLPPFNGLTSDGAARMRGRIVIAPSMTYLVRAMRAAKHGRLAAEPYLEATVPSLVDGGLVDEGNPSGTRHVMSVVAQAAPYRLREGDWQSRREELGDIVMGTLERHAPGIGALVVARQVVTPLDIERGWAATGGHPLHAEADLGQWFAWRPLHGYGRYRMPLSGFYLCGAGAHPGGGVTGAPGQLAAREMIADWHAREG
ncbi:MAG TPA: NAD(P)/FAD-dependent oxidoreductase [Candidatus Limnocylindria bacterium]|nr:NAD(P)/FAD-dependent oxidoreductase [Candidatus Limnocylindria bacterium]